MLGQLGPEQIERLLQQECIARIGCHANGVTYVVPVTYWYDGERAICRSRDGRKLQMMRTDPKVCFQVDRMRSMNEWECVIAQGIFQELNAEEAEQASRSFGRWLRPRSASVTADVEHADRKGEGASVMYAIRLSDKSGRFERPQ